MQGKTEFQQIIAGCRKRKRSSQNALYRLYYPYAMSICIRYLPQEAEAISVLNDGFLKVFQNIKKYDRKYPFKPWLRKILINTAINHLKKLKKFEMESNMIEANDIAATEEIFSKIGYRELITMIQSLSTAYRTVFNLYVIEGFKHKEIAQQLNISTSTSKSNLARARVKLQQLITEKLDHPYA